ncbi:F0F1 ATP synthase subunit delta [Chenggangzhangella methanolivorans]|uniref:ATP synthase subunit delta n=2 Tax=Chenggangzhangella methanolivorans TaxID=1437009 RepID=A0A9E6UMB9_9HYPH|nr:F0F1 ATP synthase subunit delta [Chenggangzhangella methanolivorans]
MAGKDTIVSGMAGRYASALFDLAKEQSALDAVSKDLDVVTAALAESEDLRRLIKSPVFSAEEQARAMGAVLDKLGVSGLTANFVKLVASNRRLFALESMIRGFRALAAADRGATTAEVTVAEELSSQRRDELASALKEITGKTVDFDVKVDPKILGGLIVRLGSRMVDASLKTKLNSIKLAMKEVG